MIFLSQKLQKYISFFYFLFPSSVFRFSLFFPPLRNQNQKKRKKKYEKKCPRLSTLEPSCSSLLSFLFLVLRSKFKFMTSKRNITMVRNTTTRITSITTITITTSSTLLVVTATS